MGYVANEPLRWNGVTIPAGGPVPGGDPHRRYDLMLDTGEISWVPDEEESDPVQPDPVVDAVEVPANLSELNKTELWTVAGDLDISEVEGTGSGGSVLKKDLISAIEAARLAPVG